MEEFFKNSDDYLKILLVTWLKIKDLYLDPKNKSIPLNTRVDNFIKASKIIRKQCKKSHKARKYYHILKYLENEGKSSKEILSKVANLATVAKILDLPGPINQIIDDFGLNNIEENELAKALNDMFDNIDEKDLKPKLDAIDEKLLIDKTEETIQEGTLVNFIKNRTKNQGIPTPIQNSEKILENRNIKLQFDTKNLKTIPENEVTIENPEKINSPTKIPIKKPTTNIPEPKKEEQKSPSISENIFFNKYPLPQTNFPNFEKTHQPAYRTNFYREPISPKKPTFIPPINTASYNRNLRNSQYF